MRIFRLLTMRTKLLALFLLTFVLVVFMLLSGSVAKFVKSKPTPSPAFRIYAAAVTDKLMRDQPLPMQEQPQLNLEAARNEYEGGQVVVVSGDQPLQKLQIQISELKQKEGSAKIDTSEIKLFKEHYIHVTKPTTPAYPAGWYPDALLPIDGKLEVDAGVNQAIYIKVHVPKGQPAGTYTGELTLQETGPSVRIPISLKVWDFELTDESHMETAFTLWNGYIGEAHHVSGDKSWKMIEKYYWESVEHRLTPSYLPIPTDTPEQYVEQAVPFLTNPKVSAVRLPFFRNNDGSYDEGKMKRIVDMLRDRGLLGKTYYYITEIDEPGADKYPRVKEIADMLNRVAPDVRHFVTTQPVDELKDSVHNWVSLINKYDEPFAHRLQAGGDHVWWYTSVVPKHPFPTYHIDDDLMGSRLLFWEQKDYNVEGTLFWSTTIFKKYDGKQFSPRNVWTDPMAYPGANGDGFLFYPGYDIGVDGPLNTLRIENLREGAEDYEYLWTLEQRLNETASRLGVSGFNAHDALQPYYDRLYLNMRDYNQDAGNLMQVRHDIAGEIVTLGQGIPALVAVKDVTESRREISVFTEKGASVKMAGTAAASFDPSGTASQYVSQLTLAPGLHEVPVEIEKNGQVKTVIVRLNTWDDYSYEVPLHDGETAQDVSRWIKSNVALSQSTEHAAHGTYSLKAEFKEGASFPNLRLFGSGIGFRSADWSTFGLLEFEVYNPDPNRTAMFNVKFHQTNGKTDDTFFQSVPAGESRTIRIPLNEVNVDLTQMKGIELWMNKQTQTFTLFFDNFRLTSKTSGTMMP